jgi:hypothetical protein
MNKNNLKSKPVDNLADLENNNSGFLLGIISAVLLVGCISVLLLFNNRQVQRIITEKINIDALKPPSDIESGDAKKNTTLLTQKTLNVKVDHPNGTVGRLTNISFTEENTIVEMAVTNGFGHTIHLNLHGKGLILIDDLGNKYNLKYMNDNPYLEIESGETFKGELVFQGGITSKVNHLTLITNNQIGSDQGFSRRPKMKFYIPLQEFTVSREQ